MSGPKISVYSLTGRARTIVFGQMRCEQQSLACAAQTQAIIRSISSFSGNFDQQIGNIQLLIKRTGEGAEQLENDYLLQLNPLSFNTIPHYIIAECDRIVAEDEKS